jgi:hypothetical protein
MDVAKLIERLRTLNPWAEVGWPEVIKAAATALETLQRERDEAREALKPFAEAADAYDDPSDEDDAGLAWAHDFTIGSLRRARAALSPKEAEE